jgi:acetate kinase
MRVWVVNAGSSSLKLSVVEWPQGLASCQQNVALPADATPSLEAAAAQVGRIDAVAHRIVHGGLKFRQAVRIDEGVLGALEALREIDPLHAAKSLAGVRAAQAALPDVPQVACFDTAFHAGLPEAAWRYALPAEWTEPWGLRRMGFHGLSLAHAVRRLGELDAAARRVVICHLGSGCSVTAVRDGRSLDTTMGYTPLEGLAMATRAGSVDPGVLTHLLRDRGLSPTQLEDGLERHSGLLGLSGVSGDLREVRAAAGRGDARSAVAIDVFTHMVCRGIGAVLASLDGLDALVFTGGIGEHDAALRAAVCERFAWLGLQLDGRRNQDAGADAVLSQPASRVRVWAIEAREDLTMAREAAALLGGPAASG